MNPLNWTYSRNRRCHTADPVEVEWRNNAPLFEIKSAAPLSSIQADYGYDLYYFGSRLLHHKKVNILKMHAEETYQKMERVFKPEKPVPAAEQRFREFVEKGSEHPDFWSEEACLDFKEGLVNRMLERNMTRDDLAKATGMSKAAVNRVFSDTEHVTIETMCRLAFALGVGIGINFIFKRDIRQPGRNHGQARHHQVR